MTECHSPKDIILDFKDAPAPTSDLRRQKSVRPYLKNI
jgi:hypothetical protein